MTDKMVLMFQENANIYNAITLGATLLAVTFPDCDITQKPLVPAELFFNIDATTIQLGDTQQPVYVTEEGAEHLKAKHLHVSDTAKSTKNRGVTFLPLINAQGMSIVNVFMGARHKAHDTGVCASK